MTDVQWSSERGGYVDSHGELQRRPPGFAGRAALFVLVFAALMFGWNALRDSAVEHLVIDVATVRPAAWLANLLTPGIHAVANGSSIHAPGGGLNILNGCEGIDALFVLIAGFLVAPLPARSRLLGLFSGAALLYVVNQARILLLFYAYRHDPAWFSTLHGTVTPIVVVLALAAYFYVWLYRFTPRPAAAA